MDSGEACDDANPNSGDGCSVACDLIEYGFTCSTGSPTVCNYTCGDSMVSAKEVCDDGSNDGLGCSSGCLSVRSGYICTNAPMSASSCISLCGDGLFNSTSNPYYNE